MATPVPETISSRTILMESNRIIWYNRRLFLSLYFFFIPPSLYFSISTAAGVASIYLRLFAITITGLLLICGVATVTYVTYHAFSGRVVSLSSAFKSLRYSFLPLLFITATAIIFVALSASTFVFALNSIGLGHEISSYGIITLLALLILPLQVHCALAVVVDESNWSFDKLWLSTEKLISSWRLKSLPLRSVVSYFLVGLGSMFGFYQWKGVMKIYGYRFGLNTLFYTAFNAFFVSYYTSVITILYLYSTIDLLEEEEENLFGITDGVTTSSVCDVSYSSV